METKQEMICGNGYALGQKLPLGHSIDSSNFNLNLKIIKTWTSILAQRLISNGPISRVVRLVLVTMEQNTINLIFLTCIQSKLIIVHFIVRDTIEILARFVLFHTFELALISQHDIYYAKSTHKYGRPLLYFYEIKTL